MRVLFLSSIETGLKSKRGLRPFMVGGSFQGRSGGKAQSSAQITPAQSDEISWQLRELAAIAHGMVASD